MSNSFYNATGVPATSSAAASASIRAEFNAIQAAFNLFPVLSTNASKHLIVNAGGTGVDVAPNALVDVLTNQTISGIKTFSSVPVIPTATAGDNTTNSASTAFVTASVSTAIATEVTNRNNADAAVIATEVTNRNNAIASAIATEVTNRNNADASVIGTEVTNRNNAIAALLPAGTRLLFSQYSAPTGWTQDASDLANNRMLRVIPTVGANTVSGSADPTYMNVVPAHTHGFSTGYVSNDHTHGDTGHAHAPAAGTQFMVAPNYNGTGGNFSAGSNGSYVGGATTAAGYAALGGITSNHTHSGGTDNGSSQTVWYPRYLSLILCQKN